MPKLPRTKVYVAQYSLSSQKTFRMETVGFDIKFYRLYFKSLPTSKTKKSTTELKLEKNQLQILFCNVCPLPASALLSSVYIILSLPVLFFILCPFVQFFTYMHILLARFCTKGRRCRFSSKIYDLPQHTFQVHQFPCKVCDFVSLQG